MDQSNDTAKLAEKPETERRISERRGLSKPEPDPVKTAGRPIWELVIEDMQERDRAGRAKYGTPLQANNGRDALVDAYQEVLDLAVYLRQAIEERKIPAVAEHHPVCDHKYAYKVAHYPHRMKCQCGVEWDEQP